MHDHRSLRSLLLSLALLGIATGCPAEPDSSSSAGSEASTTDPPEDSDSSGVADSTDGGMLDPACDCVAGEVDFVEFTCERAALTSVSPPTTLISAEAQAGRAGH